MQPAKNVSRGERLVVLHEPFPDSEVGHDFFVIALQKKATLVPEDLGFEKQDSGKSAGSSFHEIGLIDSKNVMTEIQGQVRDEPAWDRKTETEQRHPISWLACAGTALRR
jgi:hypothetical protein